MTTNEEPIHTIPAVQMSLEAAAAIGQHVKAALMHIVAAQNLAGQSGIDLDGPDGSGVTGTARIGPLFRSALGAVEDLDSWAVNNAGHQGGISGWWRPDGDPLKGSPADVYAGTERWCATRGGALPESAFP